jgi:hypothetical protein
MSIFLSLLFSLFPNSLSASGRFAHLARSHAGHINAVKNAFFMIMYLIKICCCIVTAQMHCQRFPRQQVSASPGIRQQQYQNDKQIHTYHHNFLNDFRRRRAE